MRTFPKTDLISLIRDTSGNPGDGFDGYKIVLNEFKYHKRWTLVYRLVFSFEENFYEFEYENPATECQEVEDFEFQQDLIPCRLVYPSQKTITTYS